MSHKALEVLLHALLKLRHKQNC